MKMFNKLGLGAVSLFALSSAHAAPVDLTSITGAVDLTTVAVAVLAIGAIMVGPKVAKYAVKSILSFIPGGK